MRGPTVPSGSQPFMLRESKYQVMRVRKRWYSHLDLDTKDTLSEHDVPDGVVNEVLSGLTGVDHETVSELHGLGTSSTKLAGNDNFTTLSTRLHDETEDTIASTKNRELAGFFLLNNIVIETYRRTARPPRSL